MLLAVTLVSVVLTATLLKGATVTAGGVVEEPGEEMGEPFPAVGDLDEGEAWSDEEERPAA